MKPPHEIVVFAKITSTSLLIIGYILAGYYISMRLILRGWPEWLQIAFPTAGAIVGLHQGYRVIREMLQKNQKGKK